MTMMPVNEHGQGRHLEAKPAADRCEGQHHRDNQLSLSETHSAGK
jgi:hypothetical protein